MAGENEGDKRNRQKHKETKKEEREYVRACVLATFWLRQFVDTAKETG